LQPWKTGQQTLILSESTHQMQLTNHAENCLPEPAILVFPATHPDGQQYFEIAQEHDDRIVAASSTWDAELSCQMGELLILPYVDEPSFPARFLELVRTRNINRIYSPVAAVYSWLDRFISENKLPIRLVGSSPIKRELARFDRLMSKVTRSRRFIDECAGGTCDLSDIEIAAVFRMASHIYGESNEHKIAAMMAIFCSAPKGDVIEIGSLVGKSAAVLVLLAKRYQTGNVLAIDPWQASVATQHDAPYTVRVGLVAEWDYEMLPQDFAINTWPVGLGSFNYLRQESVTGCALFQKTLSVTNSTFGRVDYQGKIAVLHIDGNHDYSQVKRDCELWLPMMVKGGWLILDDYVWIHGDGPRQVGDTLLEQHARDIERAFVCGKALFVKLN